VIAIVIGLQAVGVVLMSALIVAPAAAARQWTNRLSVMVALAGFFGALSGVSGAAISSAGAGLSTGPVIVLSASAIVLFSLLFAPNRGLVWRWVRGQRNKRTLQDTAVLSALMTLAAQHDTPDHAHNINVLRVMNLKRGGVQRTLHVLEAEGLVVNTSGDLWALTPAGLAAAQERTQFGALTAPEAA
jgi:manganese/zinc/iron transport system permease protein